MSTHRQHWLVETLESRLLFDADFWSDGGDTSWDMSDQTVFQDTPYTDDGPTTQPTTEPTTEPTDGYDPSGGTQDGSYQDGGSQDGSYQDGGYQDGSYQDGGYQDGSYQDGSYQDGSYQDGVYTDSGFIASTGGWIAVGFGTAVGWDDDYYDGCYVYPDRYEYDDNPDHASWISTDWQPQWHTLDYPDDHDWVYFDLTAPADVVVETDGDWGNTELWLYRANDLTNQIAYDDDSGCGDFSRIEMSGANALAPGRYFVQVADYRRRDVIPDYSIQVWAGPESQADPLFDEAYYTMANPDVAAAVNAGTIASGWVHYQYYGQYEGRDPSAYFSETYYRQTYPDVAAAIAAGTFTSGIQHFVNYGEYEGRNGSYHFDEMYYRQLYPDVAAAIHNGTVISGLEHYLAYGQYEGRSPSPGFSSSFYLGANPDVARAVTAESFSTGYEHFLLYGESEGRRPASDFSETAYLQLNPDVAAAVHTGAFVSGWEHWVRYGKHEGRRGI